MLKELKKCLASEKKNRGIHDIVLYGSFVRGRDCAGDIDILVIFLEGSLQERLAQTQEIKHKLKNTVQVKADVKQILIQDLFSESFFARTGIVAEGISIFRNKLFCETLGFKSGVLFWYALDSLSHAQKVRFNYILAGRKSKGIIELFGGERIVSGAVKIPVAKSEEFEAVLKANRVTYKKKNILEER